MHTCAVRNVCVFEDQMDSGHFCNALTHFLSRLLQDMTREQIGEEKVALQKGLLYYESIHGRPVSHNPPTTESLSAHKYFGSSGTMFSYVSVTQIVSHG